MYLVFPESMIIPETAEHLEDSNFEDWLTAALIDNTNQQGSNGKESFLPGITDVWMLEIAERKGKIWTGKVHVEFIEGQPGNVAKLEQGSSVLSFAFDTHSGEVRFGGRQAGF
jgi:hypothetical protein